MRYGLCIDPQTRLEYFIDHESGENRWILPNTCKSPMLTAESLVLLSAVRIQAFLRGSLSRARWPTTEKPLSSSSSSSLPPPPPPPHGDDDNDEEEEEEETWIKEIDTVSGNPYYYNSITREVRWEVPSSNQRAHHGAQEQQGQSNIHDDVIFYNLLQRAEES